MQNLPIISDASLEGETHNSLQAYFNPGVAPDDIAQVFRLKRAQTLLQAFTALFHGGFDGVLVRLLVLKELSSDTQTSSFSRADINAMLGYLVPDSLETVLARLRANHLLSWHAEQGVYRLTSVARNVLSAVDGLLHLGQDEDDAEMGFLFSQVAGAQAVGGVSIDQLQHLLGRMVDLTEEFRDAIASGSEFRLRVAQSKWNAACDWVEKGSAIIHAITADARADAATHRAAHAIGRAQSALLNMQGMFSRALNQIERQRVHLGQSGLSTTDIKSWLLRQEDLAALANDALAQRVTPLFVTVAEIIDVAEAELLCERTDPEQNPALPQGQDAPSRADEAPGLGEVDNWLTQVTSSMAAAVDAGSSAAPIQDVLLPASFAVASYRASLLPLFGEGDESILRGSTAVLAILPFALTLDDGMVALPDAHVAAISVASLACTANSHHKKKRTQDE
ncbi:MAG: hypothetical protein Q8Q81_12990 [Oxalobacteraceae bacterium]|nr:hypothetical protein [Oxalobacteraceae bacterium]